MTRVPTILIAGLVLTACATTEREEAAPVVQVTPRGSVAEAPKPAATPEPEKPAAPKKQQTRVFAYRDPAAEPDPEPKPAPATAADAAGPAQTAAPTKPAPAVKPSATQASAGGSAPVPAAAKPPTPATPAPKVAQTPPKPDVKAPPTPPAPARAAAPPTPPSAPAQAAEPPAAPPAPAVQVAAVPPAPALAAPGLPPAADALARQAEQQRQSGDYAGAAASLERSLRIAPREAYLWNRLARVRLEQGQAGQAGNLASRSNDLAGDTPLIKKDNWRVIAESKRRSGDIAGATEAEQRASGN
ncbi:tetratricopeptide repeat protein [Thiocapsa sp.]|uniref:tetratricopeptide repeat protein n=1 Tax=Thiocapsa sp. TaxID=2024551 RepID=UPI0025DFECD0|nr:tetratricopeptide repeat protein [Thiocapsa sp.]